MDEEAAFAEYRLNCCCTWQQEEKLYSITPSLILSYSTQLLQRKQNIKTEVQWPQFVHGENYKAYPSEIYVHQCNFCSSKYYSVVELQLHMKDCDEKSHFNLMKTCMLIQNGGKCYESKNCDKQLNCDNLLSKHRSTHTDEKFYKCKV